MKQRVLLINDFTTAGGAEVVFMNTYNLLTKSNKYDVDKFVGSNTYKRPKNPLSYIFSYKYYKLLSLKLIDFNPNIIHIHGFYHLLTPGIFLAIINYKIKHKLKVIFTAHDYYLLFPGSILLDYSNKRIINNYNIKKLISTKIDNRSITFSLMKKIQWYIYIKVIKIIDYIDIIISPSLFLKNLFEKNLQREIHLLRNPFDKTNFINKNKIKNDGQLKLIYFGRLSAEKGLIEFLELIKDVKISYSFHIYGSGPLYEDVKKYVINNHLDNFVELKGYMPFDELSTLIGNYDVSVIPSIWYENAPMTIIESYFAGLQILGRNIGGIKELCEFCGNSVLFDNSVDLNKLLKKIKNIRDNAKTNIVTDKPHLSMKFYFDSLSKLYDS